MQHLIETQQFKRETLEKLFVLADSLQPNQDESLKGKIMASLFYEPSTRTRFSFESAMLRLGGEVLSAENACDPSSEAHGETFESSISVINYYADILVIRHPEVGALERAARVSTVPIINAGDGDGQHPTQALLDLYTIQKEFGKIDGIKIAFVGDLKNGHAARALSYLLAKFKDVHITYVSSKETQIGDDIKAYLNKHGCAFGESNSMEDVVKNVDVVYQTRVQKEHFANEDEYQRFTVHYVMDRHLVDAMQSNSIIIHPLPRVGEVVPEVDDSPHAVYFRQVGYGLIVRMALLKMMLVGEGIGPRE